MIKSKKLYKKAEKAMREAVQNVVQEHKKNRMPLSIWKNGKVVKLNVKQIKQ